MAERASMPTFVPRTVASFERAATVMARRVAAPVRTLAARALSFADRLVGTWAGTGAAAGLDGGVRPAMRAAARGGAMPLPRPWYEVERDEDAIWPQQAARAAVNAASARQASAPAAAAIAPITTATSTAAAAERGAAIARTALTAPPEVVARAGERVGAANESDRGAAEANAPAAAAEDVRAAEALGLGVPTVAAAPALATPFVRATTPLARALAHAAWVDAQLRVAAPATPTARTIGGLVFVAPADVARPATREPALREPAMGEPAMGEPMREPAIAEAARARATAAQAQAATVAPAAAWTAALPDPRLPATMPIRVAQRVAEFVAGLIGVQTERDAAPAATRDLPAASLRRAGGERTFVEMAALPAAVSWRPGAAGARTEQLSARIDERAMGAWGEPAAAPAPIEAVPATTAAGTTERTYVAPVAAAARAVGAARLSQFVQQLVGVQAARATAPLPVHVIAATPASGRPAPASGRVPERVTLAATATISAPRSPMTSATATTMTSATPAAVTNATPATMTSATATKTSATPTATMAPGAMARRAEQLGGAVGVRAASLSIDFVDPARLSLLSGASPAMPAIAPVEVAATGEADTLMPPPRPLFSTPVAASAAPSLTAEEWSLVATFPSAATALQLAGARQSRQWSAPERTMLSAIATGTATTTAATAAPASTTATTAAATMPSLRTTPGTAVRADDRAAVAAGERAFATRRPAPGGAPAEWVIPTVAPAEVEARLPGGRTPRGSFTWPKLADAPLARAEWTAPAVIAVAEQTKQAAPGTPLWGALPSLVSISPSLAASTSSLDATHAPAAGELATHPAAPGTTSPRTAGGDAPAMTLMTAAATREARAAGRTGARHEAPGDGAETGEARSAPSLSMSGAAGERAGAAAGVSNVRPLATMPLMTTTPASPRDGAGATSGAAARALELARPFLRLVEGGGITGDGAARGSSAPRFYEQPQPLVAGAPSSDSASRIVEALRQSQPSATPSGDDRVSLADLTLIAIASATQQVAASPAGGGPSGASSAAAAPAAAPAADGGHGGGGKSGNPAQEIEELARAAFDELQRLFALAHERSGHHG